MCTLHNLIGHGRGCREASDKDGRLSVMDR